MHRLPPTAFAFRLVRPRVLRALGREDWKMLVLPAFLTRRSPIKAWMYAAFAFAVLCTRLARWVRFARSQACSRHFLKNVKKMSFFYSKRPPSLPKTEVFHEKNCLFLLKKTTQPRKKLNFCIKKWQKVDKKNDQKEEKPPLNFWSFAWKIENRPTFGDFEKKKSRPPTSSNF